MRSIRSVWRGMFDVRPGEGARVLFMSLYLLFVLFAYYIIKTASVSLFLNKFDIEKLPYLQILIAGVGGLLAYLYSKVAVQATLERAVALAMALSVACLAAFWWLIQFNFGWLLYLFNIWVSMFSIVTVSQGWLVAANVFNSREAKRLYGLLGLGSVVGAAFGGSFTAFTAHELGTRNLLWASAVMVVLAYVAFRLAIVQKGVSLARARGAGAEEARFSFREIPSAIARHRHLQVIIGIMLLMFMVDSMLTYQFSAMAKLHYKGDHLTAFLGSFYGIYLNLLTFVLQLFLTAPLIRWVGVGGTLQVMPVTMAAVSAVTFAAPGLETTAVARLSEAGSRYTLNRTGLELLYLPLPTELKNRTKAFVDIFMDRFGRGLGGLVLVILAALDFNNTRQVALVTFLCSLAWIALCARARKEYVQTVRSRLDARRLDFESLRINVQDPVTVKLLEQAAAGAAPRQVSYALSLLADAPGYDLAPLLARLATHQSELVRAKVYELARATRYEGVLETALTEVWTSSPGQDGALSPAVAYILSLSSQATELTRLFLDHPNWVVAEAALVALQRESAQDFVTHDWLAAAASSPKPERRAIAALAVGVRGDQGTEVLFRLLEDPETRVAVAACRAAGSVQNRAYLPALARRLAEPRVRAAAVESLAAYGTRICGTLGDMLEDDGLQAAIRRQIPRALRLIRDQRSADILLRVIGHPDLAIRFSAIKALNGLRQSAPGLDYGKPVVTRQILEEAREYFQLNAALSPFGDNRHARTASGLLARTIEERLRQTQERLFRLLGLRYPPQQIYAAYRAVQTRRAEDYAAAMEFLDNVVDRELKRVVMPMLDTSSHQAAAGRDLFGVETLTAEAAVRVLIRSTDPWLKACAIATAAEQNFRDLRQDISAAAAEAGAEVTEVARSAVAALG